MTGITHIYIHIFIFIYIYIEIFLSRITEFTLIPTLVNSYILQTEQL